MNEHLKIFGILHVKNALNLPEKIEDIYDDASERLEGFSIRMNSRNVLIGIETHITVYPYINLQFI